MSQLAIRKELPEAQSLDVYFVTFRFRINGSNVKTNVSAGAVFNAIKLEPP